jgi:predicted ATPase/DNA-binding winged helix-turn-helix (wHTH) protein
MDRGDPAQGVISFGRFQLVPKQRELLVDGAPAGLGSRAFEVLLALIEAQGALVTKEELLNRVWPGAIVEENNLHAQISAVRKVLDRDRNMIVTVAGRGYRFAAEASAALAAASDPPAPSAAARPGSLPMPLSPMVGRDAELRVLYELAASQRLVTLVGAGGIGKTRLAVELGQRVLAAFPDGVWLCELGALTDPQLVPLAVTSTLGLELATAALSPERVAAALRDKRLLLILDTCEHVLDAAARLAEALLQTAPGTRVLATSREPLAAEGEYVYRVPPMRLPPPGARRIEQIASYDAVRLLLARARAADPAFAPDDLAAAAVVTIVRRLDGIPLAIELAAARTASLGLHMLAARLDDRFRLLTAGRRTALPRHQTLRAMLDWSHDLLAARPRTLLRRLAVFVGSFTLEGADAVAGDEAFGAAEVMDGIADLVAKSLVSVDADGAVIRYRLFETTRRYALEKLAEAGELVAVARRHADFLRRRFERAAASWARTPAAEWLADYAPELDDLRAALGWAFAPGGDDALGVALTAVAAPLWIQLSLLGECRSRVGEALARLKAEPGVAPRHEMALQAALALSLVHTDGPANETAAAWSRVLGFAENLGDVEYQLRSLYGLWASGVDKGGYAAALAFARRLRDVAAAAADAVAVRVGDRLIGVALHFLGEQADARRHLERVLHAGGAAPQRPRAVRFGLDQRVGALNHLSRILWLQGFPDRALATAQTGVAEARAGGHANSLCLVLADGIGALAVEIGDWALADELVSMLLDVADRHALSLWHACGVGLRGRLLTRQNAAAAGASLLQAAIDGLSDGLVGVRYALHLGWLAEALGAAGRGGEAAVAIDEALRRCRQNQERWCLPELLRIKGALLAEADPALAEDTVRQALAEAARQGALSWELRAATDLARLGTARDAMRLVTPVYERFSEGFGTVDLVTAKALIEAAP